MGVPLLEKKECVSLVTCFYQMMIDKSSGETSGFGSISLRFTSLDDLECLATHKDTSCCQGSWRFTYSFCNLTLSRFHASMRLASSRDNG